ncbi:MAG: hypothetical protein HUJ58_00170, partial [Erysipelotrichaceae bacterium]|nr:hypothetical protein [Erysipelotrichaceae bacterium]
MKKITLLFFSLLLSASLIIPSRTQTVSAYTAQDSGYWVGMVKSSSNVTMVGTVDSYSAGVTLMNKQKSTSTNVATLFKGSKIVACKYATLDFTAVGSSSVNSYIYAQKTDGTYNSTADYFNGFYTAEGPYIVTGSTSSKAVTVVSGLRGRVNKTRNDNTQYEIVPISVAAPLNYYVADTNGNLRHYFAYFSSQSSLNIGVAPEFMEAGKKYYSYDGHYFYTKYTDLIDDLEKSVSTHAVNADAPWFNYYQFLPFHSTTNYTASDIDSYLRAKGYTQPAYTYYSTAQNGESTYPLSNQSLLYGSGSYFMQMQQIYGINPLLLLSISANESSWGRS